MIALFYRKAMHFLYKPMLIKLWFFPIWVALGISTVLIFILSIERLTPLLGYPLELNSKPPNITQLQVEFALNIGRAIRLAARYTPWNSSCFSQAILARLMLNFYCIPHILYFGLNRHILTRDLKAHAWVVAGQVTVTGGGLSFNQYTVVGTYMGLKPTS